MGRDLDPFGEQLAQQLPRHRDVFREKAAPVHPQMRLQVVRQPGLIHLAEARKPVQAGHLALQAGAALFARA